MTRDNQHSFVTVNVQLWSRGPTLHDFTKEEDPIRELSYWGIKSETRDKLRDRTKFEILPLIKVDFKCTIIIRS